MAQYENIYKTEESTDDASTKYFFVSDGKIDIIKAVEYQYVQSYNGSHLFNLAFGDYDIENDAINDQINTNNGDHYAVFNTVLSTIPKFFDNNPNATVMVQGSDNSEDFINKCKAACNKNCDDLCKNIGRRIKAYRYYVNKNYDELIKEYVFHGGIEQQNGGILTESYEKGKEYDSVFCKKRNIFAV